MKPAHVHLISAIAAEVSQFGWDGGSGGRPLRILDVGCGYGQLVADLLDSWHRQGMALPEIEVYGYEVYDHRAGTPGYRESLLEHLSGHYAGIDWIERIRFSAASDPWPFADDFIDAAFSNQVLEHVEGLQRFFAEERRVVRPGGVAVHFYPSEEIVVEPHCGVPFAHRVRRGRLKDWLRFWSRRGVGKFSRYRRERGSSLESFSDEFFDYLGRYVFFRPDSRIRSLGQRGTRSSGFAYQADLVWRGLCDDWELCPYRFRERLSRGSLTSRFTGSTLVRRF